MSRVGRGAGLVVQRNSSGPASAQPKLDDAAKQLEGNGQLDKSSRKSFQYENWAGRAKR